MRNTLHRGSKSEIYWPCTAVFLFSRIFERRDARGYIKYETAAKLARTYHRAIYFNPSADRPGSGMQNAKLDDKLADRQWFSSYNSISPEFSLFRYNSTRMQFSVIAAAVESNNRTEERMGNTRNPIKPLAHEMIFKSVRGYTRRIRPRRRMPFAVTRRNVITARNM